MDGFLVWTGPVLHGAQLLGVFDAASDDGEAAGAIARFWTRAHGHVQIAVASIDGELGPDPEDPVGLGRVEEVLEGPQGVRLRGTFGEIRFDLGAGIDLLDIWSGTVDTSVSLLSSEVPEQRLVGSVLVRPQTQVRVSRRVDGGGATDTVLSARDRVAVAHDGVEATVFASNDLTMRTLELAGLLAHPTVPSAPPVADHATGDLVVVQVVNSLGGKTLTGGTFAWLECGRLGWVEMLEEGRRQPVRSTTVAESIVAAMTGAALDG